jgi:formate hydrogenlyase subunit 3/multisubunit Na+/H+ antiporter MnhD subunit
MNSVVAVLYILITALFSINLIGIYNKYKNNKISFYSLLATISLVVMFLSLSIYFATSKAMLVILAQIYLLGTMIYIKYSSKDKRD